VVLPWTPFGISADFIRAVQYGISLVLGPFGGVTGHGEGAPRKAQQGCNAQPDVRAAPHFGPIGF